MPESVEFVAKQCGGIAATVAAFVMLTTPVSAHVIARARLDQPLTVRDLAGRANLSTRQLARRMRAELQVGPLDWLHHQRIARARELLERTDAPIDRIAVSSGMGTAATLRRHFHRTLGVTPTAYRATFRL